MKPAGKILTRLRTDATKRALLWVTAAGAAIAHTVAMWAAYTLPSPETVGWLVPLVTLAPGLATMAVLPGGWKRWYRWAAILGLTLNSVDPFIIILIGETWALHRSWVTERDAPLKSLLRRRNTGTAQAISHPKPA